MIKKICLFTMMLLSFSCSNNDKTSDSTKSLNSFLKEKDLDALLTIRSNLAKLNEKDNILIKYTLDKWEDKQAISNLLFYPNMIPKKNRFNFLLKGLTDKEISYYNLAAIVGIQSPENLEFTTDQTIKLKNELFKLTEKTNDIRAMRATTSLQQYINIEDTEKIIKCASNKFNGVQTNLLSMISTLHGKENIRNVLVKQIPELNTESKNLLKELERQELKIENAPEDKKGFFRLTLGMPLSGYIPNLIDFK